ncbi:cytochrome P450 9e2-like [Culicoides brevitarsis]|uniref:cytochrome P450 9e2-like n=1 Tax=Culicoides brevitarsis TaxID=469753 RepID=UPI00307B3EF0
MVVTTGIIVVAIVWLGNKIYRWIYEGYDLFENLGIKFIKPAPILGSNWRLFFRKTTLRETILNAYNAYPDASIVGLFDMKQPIFMIRDPEIVKQITVKDFDHFGDHRSVLDEKKEPLFGNSLVNLKGQKWREMRATLSPIFTGSKMRQMFELVSEIGAQIAEYFKNVTDEERHLEFKEMFSRFTNDVIATAAFGIEVDSLKNKQNEFFVSAKTLMDFSSFWTILRFMFLFMFPKVAKFLGIRLVPEWKTKFFQSIVTETMDYREKEGIVRPDLIHLMLQLKKGMLKLNNNETKDSNDSFAAVEESELGRVVVRRQWSDNELMAQCFIFFLAGFDTSSTAMSFLAYELAINKDIQEKLIAEIDQVNEDLNGKRLTYDALQKMKYLDMVLTESLRMWAPAELTDRLCLKDYKLKNDQGVEFTMKKDHVAWIPIGGFHYDAKYWKNPEKFDPERFSDEHKSNVNQGAYMPFGVGPRNCIGSRFALMEIKCAFYYLLLNFTIETTEKTQIPLQLEKGFAQRPEKGIWLKLEKRNK